MHGTPPPIMQIKHLRQPWAGDEMTYVCTKLGTMNGGGLSNIEGGKERVALYNEAKYNGDHDAAAKIVKASLDDRVLDRLIDDVEGFMVKGIPLICAVPHPPFDDPAGDGASLVGKARVTNALPIQYMAQIAVNLDAEIDTKIVQKGRVSRTKLSNFPRFLCQPCFDGDVRRDAAYILADDVVTSGGTLAALRSHILANGGTVAAITTLAHGSGQWQPLALSPATWQELCSIYGDQLSSFWEREIGHDARCLTDAEGRTLVRFEKETTEQRPGEPLLQCLRDRLAEAAAKHQ